MIWGAIGWDYKSELVFMEKLPGRKGICSKAYFQEVLEPVVFPLFEQLGQEYIFMEDGAKVHAGKARLPRLQHGVRGFNWPPCKARTIHLSVAIIPFYEVESLEVELWRGSRSLSACGNLGSGYEDVSSGMEVVIFSALQAERRGKEFSKPVMDFCHGTADLEVLWSTLEYSKNVASL
ncbi:hypothetical protein G7Y89_g10176 [Cudoniella acicularis]|uniref:Transposase n=1 Tax=Cudoniella acicularis TaxID=354080 RepID=A0A8H4W173_9HELO|nr:hypothetical protein G7Y89_g10176 [Cudoniella acicularis]